MTEITDCDRRPISQSLLGTTEARAWADLAACERRIREAREGR
jgi:hypothetical protein